MGLRRCIPKRLSESAAGRDMYTDNKRTGEPNDADSRGAGATGEQIDVKDAGSEADAEWISDEDFMT